MTKEDSGGQGRCTEETFLLESAMAEILAANAGFGSVEVAESKLRGVLELNPDHIERVEALNLLAQLYGQTDRHEEALEYFEVALVADPGMAVPMADALAEMFEKQEEWEWAIKVYAQGLAHVEDASLRDGLGYCLARAGRFKDAEHHIRRATELAPGNAAYINDLGFVLMEQRRHEEARALFKHALHLDPSFKLAQNNLRICSEEASESG